MMMILMVMVMVMVIMMVVVMRNVMTDDLRLSPTKLNPPATVHQMTMRLPLSDNFSKEIRSTIPDIVFVFIHDRKPMKYFWKLYDHMWNYKVLR